MTEGLPAVTLVIPARAGQAEIDAVAAARDLDYPAARLEILVVRGNQPSIQRNTALRAARGELIYFLDDDSRPDPGNLRRAAGHFRDAAVVMVGGPALCPPDAPGLEQAFQAVMGSALAFGPSRARYRRVGVLRATSEKELILCNLLARKAAVLAAGGLDEALYPNEENALMDALQAAGGRLVYDPDVVVHRRPRRTLGAFARMVFTYGRGRAEQFRLHPTAGSLLNFAPPLLCAYVLATPFLPSVAWWLWAAYGAALALQALGWSGEPWGRRLAALPLVVLSHLGYGLGFWRGVFTGLRRDGARGAVTVQLERITPA
jgi:glycosyltransferase involved in cell wall biosynthesis